MDGFGWRRPNRSLFMAILLFGLACTPPAWAHDVAGHGSLTYEVSAAIDIPAGWKKLRLQIVDTAHGGPTPARFSLEVNGREYIPEGLGADGLRFVSIHQGKKQQFVVCYSRGTGWVDVPLPADAQQVVVHAVKGFEYRPATVTFAAHAATSEVTVTLDRWTDTRAGGWIPVEEHAHYDRPDPAHDADWLTMLAGDDIGQAHFMVLKGGNLPGIWAAQHAYGSAGEAKDGERMIRPGGEYRDSMQGHINLLGVTEVIEPLLTGVPEQPHHWPPFIEVLLRAKALGGVVGPAHGTELGLSSTGVADTVLGGTDFFEIANTNRYKVDVWYRLLNCGFIVPPVGGTDLPNYPSRAPWQPFFGEVRTYVRTGGEVTFEAFKAAIARGETVVSSGPAISLSVNGAGPGGTVRLPAGGGDVELEAELSSPRELQSFEIVRQGTVEAMEVVRTGGSPVNRWRIKGRLRFERSAWVAARGTGEPKTALLQEANVRQHTIAHTAPVRVLVGDEPITSAEDAGFLVERLKDQIALYEAAGKYARPEDRTRMRELLESAVQALQPQLR